MSFANLDTEIAMLAPTLEEFLNKKEKLNSWCAIMEMLLELCKNLLGPIFKNIHARLNIQDLLLQTEIKEDMSPTTLGDYVIQQILEHVFAEYTAGFVGEEGTPTEGMAAGVAYYLNEPCRVQISKFKANIIANAYAEILNKVVCFVDPIDGTKEYNNAAAQNGSTICIGFADKKSGEAVADAMFSWGVYLDEDHKYIRVSHEAREFMAHRKAGWVGNLDGFECQHILNQADKPSKKDTQKPFIAHMEENGFVYVESNTKNEPIDIELGGCGNKILHMVMNVNKPGARSNNLWAYVQMRNLQRWDTCAAEAILRANGGDLFKLFQFVSDNLIERYLYKKDEKGINTDFTQLSKKHLHYTKEGKVIFGENYLIQSKDKVYAIDDLKNNFRYHFGPKRNKKTDEMDEAYENFGMLKEHVNVFGLVAIAKIGPTKTHALRNALEKYRSVHTVENQLIFM
eukprot:gene656-1093_t